MAYQFSFSHRQWWGTVAGLVALLLLMFAAGFVGGVMWQRARVSPRSEEAGSPPVTPAPKPSETTAPQPPSQK